MTELEQARQAMQDAERVVIWRKAARDMARRFRDAAGQGSRWVAVEVLADAEVKLALADLEQAERRHDALAEEMMP